MATASVVAALSQMMSESYHFVGVVRGGLHGHLALGVGDDVALDLRHLVAHLQGREAEKEELHLFA